jgi:hypothetical protein
MVLLLNCKDASAPARCLFLRIEDAPWKTERRGGLATVVRMDAIGAWTRPADVPSLRSERPLQPLLQEQ